MPSLKDIRRRINSVKNTQKITRAMKLVAAAKLRRAQESIWRARPYAHKLHDVVRDLALRAEAADHPLLAQREARQVMVVVLTSDRGLCGAFNTNILRATETYREENEEIHETIELSVVGRKGQAYYGYREIDMAVTLGGVEVDDARTRATQICDRIVHRYVEGSLDRVLLVYNEFKSAMSQRVTIERLLPIEPADAPPTSSGAPSDFKYEPDKATVLDQVVPMYVLTEIHRALLETTASEHGSRMTAMENATNNASDMVNNLTLEYNKARQAAITKELLEIVAGAEAL